MGAGASTSRRPEAQRPAEAVLFLTDDQLASLPSWLEALSSLPTSQPRRRHLSVGSSAVNSDKSDQPW